MGEQQIPVTQARAELAELVNRVAYAGERIELTRHGKVVAALVSAADLERLQDAGQVRQVGFTGRTQPAPPGSSAVMPAAAHDRSEAPAQTGDGPQA